MHLTHSVVFAPIRNLHEVVRTHFGRIRSISFKKIKISLNSGTDGFIGGHEFQRNVLRSSLNI